MPYAKKQTIDVMLDLETLGNKNSPVIIQISAVAFDITKGKLLNEEFDEFVSPMSSVKYGLEVDGGTVAWWLTQQKEAIVKIINKSIEEGDDLAEVQKRFNKWVKMLEEKYNANIKFWSNGVLADGKWSESAYLATGVPMPWKYFQHEDVRTLVSIGKRVYGIDPKKTMPFTGIKHNAIDDCKHQIKYCSAIYKEAKKGVSALKKLEQQKKKKK